MNKRFSRLRRLLSVWYLFIGWAIISVVALALIFGLKTAYKPEEQLSFFIAAEKVEADGLMEELGKVKPEYLDNVKLTYCDALNNETIYNVNWMQATALATDIYVLPESKISAEACNAYFLPLTKEFLEENFRGAEYYAVNDTFYGLKVDKSAFKDFISYADGDYYLCFGRHCVHTGGLYGFTYDGAVQMAKTFAGGGNA